MIDPDIITRSPVRFDFSGGPSDVAPFKSYETGKVFNTALKIYAWTSIRSRSDFFVRIESKDLKVSELIDLSTDIELSGPLKLIKAIIKFISPEQGFDIQTSIDTPVGSGLGSSAAIAVSCLTALYQFKENLFPDKHQLARDALYIENVLLNNINGGQDQYASALGGFNYFEFYGDKVQIDQVNSPGNIVEDLQKNSFFCYSGESRLSGNVLGQIMNKYYSGDKTTTEAIRNIRNIAELIKNMINDGNLTEYPEIIQQAMHNQRNLHPKLVTPAIERIVDIADNYKIYGLKVAGAGGGGCVYIYSNKPEINDLKKYLRNHGYFLLPFIVESSGVVRVK